MILLLFFEEEYTSARNIPLTLQLGKNDVAGPQKKTPVVLVGVVPPPPHPLPPTLQRTIHKFQVTGANVVQGSQSNGKHFVFSVEP